MTGRNFDLSKSSLAPLEPFRKHLTIVSNTDARMAEAVVPAEVGGDHFRSSAVMYTHMRPKLTEGSDVRVGTSMDQLYVRKFGKDTPIPSMQLSIEPVDQSGGCAYGYACVYTDTISWAAPDQPLPMVRDPRMVFELMFGAGGTPEQRAVRRATDRSILDMLSAQMAGLKGVIGAGRSSAAGPVLEQHPGDRAAHLPDRSAQPQRRDPRTARGAGWRPDSFDEHVKLMFDLQVLAFQSDTTRVFSFKFGRDASGRVYPLSGIDTGFHNASHHGVAEERIRQFSEINKYHVSLLPYFLDKLQGAMDGESNLLEKTLVIYGSPMSNGNLHNHRNCPLILLGHGGGVLEGGVHIKAAEATPMANVMLTLLQKLGLDDMTSFGDSTGSSPCSDREAGAT